MRFLLIFLALPLLAERITVPLRDPSRPAVLKVGTVNGSIQVKSHPGREVFVDMEDPTASTRPSRNGMKEILIRHNGVSVEEENNVVTVKPENVNGSFSVVVPEKTTVHIKSVNGKELRIEGIEGEINAETTNGSIVIVDASGPIVAHSLNGRVTASMKHVPAGKPMSFSTLNGRIELTLPASAKADLKINNQRGETYSDFEMSITTAVSRNESNRENGPKYRLNMERIIVGQINGGGPEISMRSMNGAIYIRKAK